MKLEIKEPSEILSRIEQFRRFKSNLMHFFHIFSFRNISSDFFPCSSGIGSFVYFFICLQLNVSNSKSPSKWAENIKNERKTKKEKEKVERVKSSVLKPLNKTLGIWNSSKQEHFNFFHSHSLFVDLFVSLFSFICCSDEEGSRGRDYIWA